MKHSLKSTFIVLVLVLTISLTGCTFGESGKYKYYVESLITANYLGISDEYIKATGADETEAEALYLQNMTRLADNLNTYYDFNISSDHDLAPKMVELAKKIYSKTKFEVSDSHKDSGIYYVNIKIWPINILNQTAPAVDEYINSFNARAQAGEFNGYTQDEYESEYAGGIMDILFDACDHIEYKEPIQLTLRILSNKDSFYISDSDFRAIDTAILATTEDAFSDAPGSETDSPYSGQYPDEEYPEDEYDEYDEYEDYEDYDDYDDE